MNKITIYPPQVKNGAAILSATLTCGLKSWEQRLVVHGVDDAQWLDNTGDVWGILFLFKMMEHGGDYRLRGSISASLLSGIDRYVQAWARLSPEHCRPIRLIPDEITDDSQRILHRPALACFSGGLDACFTAYRHSKGLAGPQTQQLEACLFIKGADIRIDREQEWIRASASCRRLVEDLGIQHFYTVETNFRQMHCHYELAYYTMLTACMRLFGRRYGHLMLGSDDPVHWFVYPWGNNPVTNHLLSSHGCEIITDGLEFTRTDKARLVAQWPLALELLRSCYSGRDLSRNCGHCDKCRRTRLNFMAVGVNDLPCMPPVHPNESLLPDKLSESEHQELTLLTEYLDKNPISPTPLWEKKLREKLAKPVHYKPEPLSLWTRLCRWRKTLSGLFKLWRGRQRVQSLWLATKRGDSKPLATVMRELREFVISGKAFPVRSLIHSYFLFRLQYQGADAAPFVFESEWLHEYVPISKSAGEECDILENKARLWKALSLHGIARPRRWGVLRAEQHQAVVESEDGRILPLKQLLAEQRILFCKPADGMKGMGCLKLENGDDENLIVNNVKVKWNDFTAMLSEPLITEEYVQQHPDMEALHPQSLNTLRLVTLHTSAGRYRLATCMQRMGVGDMHLDNLSSGGVATGITDEGTLKPFAYYADPTKAALREHPDTGVIFNGREIPYFREAVNLAYKAHALFPHTYSVGWDIAITSNGPLIIEANVAWGFINIQIVNGGLRHVLDCELRPAVRALTHPSAFKRASIVSDES